MLLDLITKKNVIIGFVALLVLLISTMILHLFDILPYRYFAIIACISLLYAYVFRKPYQSPEERNQEKKSTDKKE